MVCGCRLWRCVCTCTSRCCGLVIVCGVGCCGAVCCLALCGCCGVLLVACRVLGVMLCMDVCLCVHELVSARAHHLQSPPQRQRRLQPAHLTMTLGNTLPSTNETTLDVQQRNNDPFLNQRNQRYFPQPTKRYPPQSTTGTRVTRARRARLGTKSATCL